MLITNKGELYLFLNCIIFTSVKGKMNVSPLTEYSFVHKI